MRLLIQRVMQASVTIEGQVKTYIEEGLLVFMGVEEADEEEDAYWLSEKLVKLRIFEDDNRQMNYSIAQIEGEILIISQFTLHASTKKGNRPSYMRSARPEKAALLYEYFVQCVENFLGKPVRTGIFGANMKVGLINDGPVTLWLDSKNKE